MIGLPPLSPVKQRTEPLLLGSETRVIWVFPSEGFLMELTERLPDFDLKLHPRKSRPLRMRREFLGSREPFGRGGGSKPHVDRYSPRQAIWNLS